MRPEASNGWGRNHVLDFGEDKVFVKRVPLTDLEVANPFSTRNLYGIPTYYNYGVGSAGFGAFRELVANIKVTNWVLNGEIETFPLLHHYRISKSDRPAEPVEMERHQSYVDYWGGDEGISRYMLDRASSTHELVLFLEYVPSVFRPWLSQNLDRTGSMVESLLRTAEFLRGKGMVHFDAHFHNVMTDGEHVFLTDFGLALDQGFELSEDERAFLDGHLNYDYCEILSCLYYFIEEAIEALPVERRGKLLAEYGIEDGDIGKGKLIDLLGHIREIEGKGLLKLAPSYVDCVARYRDVIVLTIGFFRALRQNQKKDTRFPREELRKALVASGVVAPNQ